jgi:hypothetical protein
MLTPLFTEKQDGPRVYRDEHGRLFVGVTSAMALVKTLLNELDDFAGVPKSILAVHAYEGESCHRACLDWLAFTNRLLPSFQPPEWNASIHPDKDRFLSVICNALQGWQEFVDKYEVEPLGIEVEGISPTYGFCGHVDLPCALTWKGKRRNTILDLKFTASILESHRLQVRCYSKLDPFKGYHMGMIFQGDRTVGDWRIEPVDLNGNPHDLQAVSMAARLHSWAAQRSLIYVA